QSYQGGLRGAVHDASGAVVPGVDLTLTNEETNTARSAITNGEGEYAFANVLPGLYTLRVSKGGYKKYEHKSIRIATQEFITLDVKLEIGQTTESVTISGEAAVLETSNPSIATTLETRALQELPTPARNVFFLSVATPSVVPTGDPQFVRQQDQTNSSLLSLGGGPRRANNYTIDGVSITDLRNRAVFIPNIESVQEVRVQVSTYDAEMGRTGGGVFNATAKSGGNEWHGSAVLQNRPSFASSQLFFAKRANAPKPETYYYLYGGSFGGPIIKDRTFFWASTESYKTLTSRNATLTLPTARELTGDFSQSGVTVYDPLTTRPNPAQAGTFIRDPFPGNTIPANRINPVAKAVSQFFPKVASGTSSTASLIDRANQATGKVEHRWSDKFTTTGFYGWYDSVEPEARFYAKNLGENPGEPAEGQLFRTVHAVAINNIITTSNNTVFAFRYGYTQFVDNDIPNQFDPATLGFSQNFLSAVPYKKFPRFAISGYGTVNFDTFGDRDPQDTTFYGHTVAASVSKLFGSHTLKGGFDYRIIGMKLFARGQPSGRFSFDSSFTRGPNPLTGGALQHSLAGFLLGFPSGGDVTIGSPNNFFINYYAGYVHDDFRVNSKLTLNLGLRYEFEQGLQERENQITVGFSRDKAFPAQVPGLNLVGGLLYAGVDGAPTHQSDPSKKKFAPRVGLAYRFSDKVVLRGGYGIFYSPNQYAFPDENRMGTRGFTAVTTYVATTDGGLTPCSTCTLTNPFPNGVERPVGGSLGLRTGAGGNLHFVDQFRKSAYVHQYSADLQYELSGGNVVSAGYVGARSERLSVGGTNSNTVNINQLDRSFLSQGTRLLEQVPNPMFGNAAFGALGRQQTVPRGQLLRPFPQFQDIFAHQVSAGFARYHSMVFKFERRIARGWGANINYTYSRNKDNLFGEVNYFSNNSNGLARALDNNDLKAEFAPSVIEAPHRLNVSGIYELPFGKGKKYLDTGGPANWFLGGWQISAIGSYQSGFPVVIVQDNNNSGLFGSFQRPNLVAGQDPKSSGSTEDRLNKWFNPAAWEPAAPFTFGNAPRTDTRARTPIKKNWDIAFQKNQRLSERFTLQLRAEVINAFDNPNFLGPATRFGRADFGQITQVGGFPRLLQ
ncbi:MAG TPA: TonB-dependent receptor, partial [Blastocatellia bacterium]|nr:TonB-dependent receptor [Blastocatellia bacterium]